MVGQVLSHYKVLEEISRGGMGIVYRAVDTKLDREVALKVLPTELVADPERKRRFVQEAKAAAKLDHPHIAAIHEIDEADGVTFIAMELIEGEYVRSFCFLGKIHENRGEMDKARDYYRRFYAYWKDGDMDRERVEEVRQKLQELEVTS